MSSSIRGVAAVLGSWVLGGCKPREGIGPTKKNEKEQEAAAAKAALKKVEGGKGGGRLGYVQEGGFKPGKPGGRVTYLMTGNPSNLNPIIRGDSNALAISLALMYETFLRFDIETMQVVDGLAALKEISGDGKRWRFQLKPNLKWSDGKPLTIDDVIFTLDAILNPKIANPLTEELKAGGIPIRYKKVTGDPLGIEFQLPKPMGAFRVALTNLTPIPKHIWEKSVKAGTFAADLNNGTPPERQIGSGPFQIKEYEADQRVVLIRNPQYYRTDANGVQLPYLDEIYFLIVPDMNTALAKMVAGEIDVLYEIDPSQLEIVRRETQRPGARLSLYDAGTFPAPMLLTFNQNPGVNKDGKPYVPPHLRKLFEDVRFRRAISHAIDRQGLVRTVHLGEAVPLYCFETAGKWAADCPKYEYNPEEAKRLVREMGLKDGDGDGICENAEGNPVRILANTAVEKSDRVQALTFIRADLRKICVDLVVKPIPRGSIGRVLRDTFDWELMFMGWTGSYPHPLAHREMLPSAAVSHFWNPRQEKPVTPWEAEIDRLVERMEEATTEEGQYQAYAKIQGILGAYQPMVMLYAPRYYIGADKNLQNLAALPMAIIGALYNAEELWWSR